MAKSPTKLRYFSAGVLALAATACVKGPAFLGQKAANEDERTTETEVVVVATSEQDGAVTGTVLADATNPQLIQASDTSNIAGSTVLFPPGAINIETEVTVKPGEGLTDEATLAALDISGAEVLAEAPAVTVTSSAEMDASLPFTLAIPLPNDAGLYLDDPFSNLVVLYTVKKVGEGDAFTGVFTREMLVIDGDLVKFETKHFGTFQAVITKQLLAVATEKSATVIAEEKAAKEAEDAAPVGRRRRSYYLSGFGVTTFGADQARVDGFQGWLSALTPYRVRKGDAALTTGFVSKTQEEVEP